MNPRDLILSAVEAAKGWQFVASHSLIKIPGFTEPVDVLRMNYVAVSALAAQLVLQVDESDSYKFDSTRAGRCNVYKISENEVFTSKREKSRPLNTLAVMKKAGFI